MTTPEHHKVAILGGGPAGLPLAVILGGQWPVYRGSTLFEERYAQLHHLLERHPETLLGLDFRELCNLGIAPADLFRLLHHPGKKFRSLDQIAYTFQDREPLDYILITREEVGGLWNNVPRNLLTLSPGQWMEFGFYPLRQWADENGIDFDVNDLIIKHRLVEYYHSIPERFGQSNRIRTHENVERIEPHDRGFLISTRKVGSEQTFSYTSEYLVYAVGQRCILRQLDAPGADLPFVQSRYDRPEDIPGQRVMIVGGGRSADWAATELFDAGRDVTYVQRQPETRHLPLINDSFHLPYYRRIAEIMRTPSGRWHLHYETEIERIDAIGKGGRVQLRSPGESRSVDVDHVVLEIGGIADYGIFKGFPELSLVDKYDDYRFQVRQMRTHPHNYESIDVPNLYPGGYLAEGIGLVVYAMHGTTYAIAGDILQKEGIVKKVGLERG